MPNSESSPAITCSLKPPSDAKTAARTIMMPPSAPKFDKSPAGDRHSSEQSRL
jgi:hypothetical protein